jgi:hypothetical protein
VRTPIIDNFQVTSTAAPTVLLVFDGWGCSPRKEANAIALARTPAFTRLMERYPHTTLNASGEAVGLPAGQMGNSEVGHMNMGAGRVAFQDLTRIDRFIRDGEFFANPVLASAMARCAAAGRSLHLVGLVSDGGVHSHIRHLDALIEMGRRLRRGPRTFAVERRPGTDCEHQRALLRDGSRQALAPDETSVRRHGPRRGNDRHLASAMAARILRRRYH